MGDIKASIAALAFILSSAARYNVDGETLSSEMQQLGLPKGNTISPHQRLVLLLQFKETVYQTLLLEKPFCV